MRKISLLIITAFSLNILYANSPADTLKPDIIEHYKNNFGISTATLFLNKDFYGFRCFYRRDYNNGFFTRYESLYLYRFIPFSPIINRSDFALQFNDSVKISADNEKYVLENYILFAGTGVKKYITERSLFFYGINACFGLYKTTSEFVGSIDSLKNITYHSNYSLSYTIDQYPFSIEREETYFKTGLEVYAGLEFFFTKRFSCSVRPIISFNYFLLKNTTTQYSGAVQYPANPSQSYRQIIFENLFPYIAFHF